MRAGYSAAKPSRANATAITNRAGCRRWPCSTVKLASIAAQFMADGVIALFGLTLKDEEVKVVEKTFDTIEELQAALVEFATRYNETWLVARHGYRTPTQVRADQCRLDQLAATNLKMAA